MKNYHYDDDPLLASCGISIEKQFAQVEGRVLEAPKVVIYFYFIMHIFIFLEM